MKKFLPILAVAFVMGVISYFITSKSKPSVLPPALQVHSWKGVVPGKTTTQEIQKSLGAPLSSVPTGTGVVLTYPSSNEYWNNEITTQQNRVVFVKERAFPLTEGSYEERKKNFTSTPIQLYGPDSIIDICLFVYVEQGTALLANPNTNVLYEQWYFPPTTFNQFLQMPEVQGFSVERARGSDI